ncbi:hypothetical protein [uncultured Paracoccus sp.]|uniref:hypothetical protein n=1 Tax=uncultured Paracoccus sp. TaxID=189685 RepID=UPI00260952A1|nr:hypothetical protein [uncultured Paracoccus sp.]
MSTSDSFDDQNRPRFGAPIDRSQEVYEPSPYAPRRSLPHGNVSLDGDRAYPTPSLTSKVLVWGGAAVAAAAVTAGSVLAVRKVADLVTGNDELDRGADRAADKAREQYYESSRRRPHGSLAPRFAGMSEDERERMRERQRRREAEMEQHTRGIRAQAGRPSRRPRPPQMSLIDEIEHTAQRLSNGAESVVGSLSAAMAGFRQVAQQAQGVMQEFHSTADQIRSMVSTDASGDGDRQGRRSADAGSFRRTRRNDVVDLRDNAQAAQPGGSAAGTPDDARTHTL